ncbi:MAG: ion transporter [Planctomycetota bacterium]
MGDDPVNDSVPPEVPAGSHANASANASASASSSAEGSTSDDLRALTSLADRLPADMGAALRDWTTRAANTERTAPRHRVWALFEDGITLLGRDGLPDEVRHPLFKRLERMAERRLQREAREHAVDLARHADGLLGQFEHRVYQLTGEATGGNSDTVEALKRLQVQLDLFAPILAGLSGSEWTPFDDLMVRVDSLEREVRRRIKASPRNEALQEAIREVHGARADALARQSHAAVAMIDLLLAHPEAATTDSYVDELWACSGAAEKQLAALHEAAVETPELSAHVPPLEAAIERISARLAGHIQTLDADRRKAWLHKSGTGLRDQASEMLTDAEDFSLPAAVYGLKRAYSRLDSWLALWPAEATRSTEARKELKPLRTARKRLFNEWVEKSVASRLERRFGWRFVWLLENTILFLIIAVVVLLILESIWQHQATANADPAAANAAPATPAQGGHADGGATDADGDDDAADHDGHVPFGGLDPETAWTLALIDTAICFVFLFEFFLKLAFSPHRLNYFKRHWFFDLLPSIPFGMFAYVMESAAAAGTLAAGAEQAHNLEAARMMRFLRLPRLVRYVRILRPVIRIGRILLFALRGMDRLVRRYGAMLNRDIMFFERPPRQDAASRLLERAIKLRRRVRQVLREQQRGLPVDVAAGMLTTQAHEARYQATLVGHMVNWSARQGEPDPEFDEPEDDAGAADANSVRPGVLAGPKRSGRTVRVDAGSGRRRKVAIETVCETLIQLDADAVEELMDPDFPRQVEKISRVCALPPLRWMPFFRDVALARRQSSNHADLSARVARALGRRLQWLNGLVTWFGDLHGVVTAPQLVDRVGGTLVKSTQRLAYRLLYFGLTIGGLLLVLGMMGVGSLDEDDLAVANQLRIPPTESQLEQWRAQYPEADLDQNGLDWLEAQLYAKNHLPAANVPGLYILRTNMLKFAAMPVLVVGVISLLVMLLGRWLQRIASQATDFYTRAAEAQFINLLADVKQARAVQDHSLLDRRVLRPEALVQGLADSVPHVADEDDSQSPEASGNDTSDAIAPPHGAMTPKPGRRSASGLLDAPRLFRRALDKVFGSSHEAVAGSLPERVYLLYRDYLTGTPLHRSDNRTTNQLLGNLGMIEVRNRILKLSKREQNQLDALDLATGGLTGPSLWFNFITLAVAQRVAQLVVDYNDNVIPTAEIKSRPPDERFRYEQWMRRKRSALGILVGDEAYEFDSRTPASMAGENNSYSTTVFNAIDFLTNDPQRHRDIAARFGPDLAAFVTADRQRTVREIFGILPLHDRPDQLRAFNPYQLYWQYLGGGRIAAVPFVGIWLMLKGTGFLLRRFWRTLRELLNPQLKTVTYDPGSASYHVAARKILRMRKPAFMAATKLRAMIDVEYLGLLLPGEHESGLEGSSLEDDLDLVGAVSDEREPLRQIGKMRREALARFADLCERHGLTRDGLKVRLAALPDYPHTAREVLRAMAAAYITDFDQFASRDQAQLTLERAVVEAVAANGKVPDRTWIGWGASHARYAAGTIAALPPGPARTERRRFRSWWRHHCERIRAIGGDESLTTHRARRCVRAWWFANVHDVRRHMHVALTSPDGDPAAAVAKTIEHLIGNPHTWTEHLVTLRTIQSLTILDMLSDRRLVLSLGEFEDTDELRYPIVVPTL